MVSWRFSWVAGALVLVVLGASGCSSITGDRVASAPPAKAGARTDGRLTVGITPPGGIDPVNAYEPVGKLISGTMCDTPVTLDPVTGQVREGLTKSLVFSPDGTTITFKMRRGLTFNDGTKLTPKDVDFSYQLLHARSTASYVRGLIEPFAAGVSAAVGGSGSKGGESVLADDIAGAKNLKPIAQALNDADFQMFAGKGNGGAVRALAEPALAPISRAAYLRDPVAFSHNPVCVGPYRLQKPYVTGDRAITLVRTPGYYGQNVGYTGGGKGYLDTIVFRIYATPDLAFAAYGKGEVDVVAVPPARAAAAARFGADLLRGTQTGVDYLGLPDGLDPYSDRELRQALSAALDRSALAGALGGDAVPATGFVPSALGVLPGANGIRSGARQAKDSTGASFAGCDGFSPRPDLARAKALLAQARANGTVAGALAKPLTLYVNTDGTYPVLARLVAQQWHAALGLTVNVKPLRWAEYLQKATQGPGFDGPFHLGWASDATAPETLFNDAQGFLEPVFTGQGASNWEHWSSTDFDFALHEDAARKTDVRERGVFFRRLEAMLCREMPVIPVAFTTPVFLVRTSRFASARPSYLAQSTGAPVLREVYQR